MVKQDGNSFVCVCVFYFILLIIIINSMVLYCYILVL